MTGSWLALPAVFFSAQQQPSRDVYDNILEIEWHKKVIELRGERVTFSEGVKATYGPTVLTADRLVIYVGEKRGEAIGNVKVTDPVGTFDASAVTFNWMDQTGSGTDVSLMAKSLILQAGKIDITPQKWTLTDVYATPCSEGTPLVSVRSPSVSITPGRGGTARRASFSLLNNKIVTLPSYRFSFNKREQAIRLPSPSYNPNSGFGLSWASSIPLNEKTNVRAGFSARQREAIGANIEFTRSLLPPDETSGLIPPISELGERFDYGYLDSIYTAAPVDERTFLGYRRSNISFGAALNQTAVARESQTQFTKPIDITFEEGRTLSGVSYIGQVRGQTIRASGGPTQSRMIVSGVALLPSIQLAPGLSTHVRLNGSTYFNKDSTFTWGVAQAGLVYQPSPRFSFGAAFISGFEAGSPAFAEDRLFSVRGYHLRGDFDFGNTKLSVLSKYDLRRREWYDNEIGVRQIIGGCFEPFFVFREFPRSYSFGVRLVVDDLLEALRSRQRQQPGAAPAVPMQHGG